MVEIVASVGLFWDGVGRLYTSLNQPQLYEDDGHWALQ